LREVSYLIFTFICSVAAVLDYRNREDVSIGTSPSIGGGEGEVIWTGMYTAILVHKTRPNEIL